MIDAKGVEKYLKRAEIAFSSPEEGSWIIEQTNDAGGFSITIQIAGGWISFAVLPLIEDVLPAAMARLAFHIARLNSDAALVKFAIDADNDVTVSVELPREGVNDEVMKKALHYLDYYIDRRYESLKALSQDPKAPSRYLD